MSAGRGHIRKGDKTSRQSVGALALVALFVSVCVCCFAPQQVTVDSLPGTDLASFKA